MSSLPQGVVCGSPEQCTSITFAQWVVRKEAIVWLGQSEDPRALAYIERVLMR
jgi:hypothetical protein